MTTFYIILEQSMIHMPLVIGSYISFSLLKVSDLSIESAYLVGALFGSYALMGTSSMPISIQLMSTIGASILGGSLVGATASLLTQKGGFPHLLSSIITFGFFHGFTQFIAPAYMSLSHLDTPLRLFPIIPQYPELVSLVAINSILLCIAAFLLNTQLGYAYAIYGNNPLFFKNYGISTSFVFIMGITCAGALAGVSGYLFAQTNNFFELNMGLGKVLFCITALILGKGLVDTHKPYSIMIPIVATGSYFCIQQMLLKIGFNLKYFTAVQALIVLIIMLYTYRTKPLLSHDILGV